jgi:hypothetical protein
LATARKTGQRKSDISSTAKSSAPVRRSDFKRAQNAGHCATWMLAPEIVRDACRAHAQFHAKLLHPPGSRSSWIERPTLQRDANPRPVCTPNRAPIPPLPAGCTTGGVVVLATDDCRGQVERLRTAAT